MPESRFVSSSGTGLIAPSTFVKLDAAYGRVIQSGSTEIIFGISQPGTHNAPYPSLDDAYAGRNDSGQAETIMVYTFPDKEVLLAVATTAPNAGDRFGSGALGVGVVATSGWVGAVAKTSGQISDLVPVDCLSPAIY